MRFKKLQNCFLRKNKSFSYCCIVTQPTVIANDMPPKGLVCGSKRVRWEGTLNNIFAHTTSEKANHSSVPNCLKCKVMAKQIVLHWMLLLGNFFPCANVILTINCESLSSLFDFLFPFCDKMVLRLEESTWSRKV